VNTGATTTATGLAVTAVLDTGSYPTGTQVSDKKMADLEDRALARHAFHGDWNYALLPAPRPASPEPPRPAGPDAAVLHDLTALAGLTARDLDDLAASITTAWHAQLEASLYQARGGPAAMPAAPAATASSPCPATSWSPSCTTATAPPATPSAPWPAWTTTPSAWPSAAPATCSPPATRISWPPPPPTAAQPPPCASTPHAPASPSAAPATAGTPRGTDPKTHATP
jgi:hypothetical protein